MAATQGDAAEAESANADIPSLVSEIASSDSGADRSDGRERKEVKDFSAPEAELEDAVETLQRTISIIRKEMAKNHPSNRRESTPIT